MAASSRTGLKATTSTLEEFDSVIGPVYLGGARGPLPDGHFQMCILDKAGETSRLALDLRSKIQALPISGSTGPVTTRTQAGALKFGGKSGPGLTVIVVAGVAQLITSLTKKIMEELQQDSASGHGPVQTGYRKGCARTQS